MEFIVSPFSATVAEPYADVQHSSERIQTGTLADLNSQIAKLAARMEERIDEVVILLKGQDHLEVERTAYTSAEFAKKVKRTVRTVRKWCLEGRIKAAKRRCGRGEDGEWSISHAELERYSNHGLLPSKN